MKIVSAILILTALGSTLYASESMASHRQLKKKAPPQVFSAIEGPEEDTLPTLASAPTDLATGEAISANAVSIEQGARERSRKDSGDYDTIPVEKRDSIANRLKMIEQLITRHGRAYDYRNHTSHELEMILAKLNTESARKKEFSDLPDPKDDLPEE